MLILFDSWENIEEPGDKKDFIRYLKILCSKAFTARNPPITIKEAKLLERLCIPVLEKYDGLMNDNMDTYNHVGSYGFNFSQVRDLLEDHYQTLTSWVTTKKAAEWMNCSEGWVRKLAREGIPTLEAKKHPAKGWRINLVSIIDYLIRTKKVQIA